MTEGPPQQGGSVTEGVMGHRGSSRVRAGAGACRVLADACEEEVLEGRLLLDVLDLGGWGQLP